jgi:hypothetical protein
MARLPVMHIWEEYPEHFFGRLTKHSLPSSPHGATALGIVEGHEGRATSSQVESSLANLTALLSSVIASFATADPLVVLHFR